MSRYRQFFFRNATFSSCRKCFYLLIYYFLYSFFCSFGFHKNAKIFHVYGADVILNTGLVENDRQYQVHEVASHFESDYFAPHSENGFSGNKVLPGSSTVILVYPLNGCRRLGNKGSGEDYFTSNEVELQSPRQARDIALSELERRINTAVVSRRLHSVVSPVNRSLDSKNDRVLNQVDFTTNKEKVSPSHIFNMDEQNTSIKLKTRYLNALQMEVANVPETITEDEMLKLASDIPCVQMVSKDYIKRIQDKPDLKILGEYETSSLYNLNDKFKQETELFTEKNKNQPLISREVQKPASRFRNVYNPFSSPISHIETPNDILFPDQWHLAKTERWGVDAQEAWDKWKGSASMVIAVIDSGCDLSHPDLKDKRWINSAEVCGDGIDNDMNGYIDDCYGWDWVDNDNDPSPNGNGHGTAAAGIIAASTNNNLGIAGICWNCKIMCLRFIERFEGRVSNQVSAIDYAAKMGAKISNNSYGGYGYSKLEYEVIRRVRAFGHLFVSSAGNNNYNTDLPQHDHTPSIYDVDNILAVGASTTSGRKASFSNYGKSSVDIFAPGSRITTVENGGGYATVSGTSFAAPMLSGAAALVWSRFPMLEHTDIKQALLTTCKISDSLSNLSICGGVVSISKAMDKAEELSNVKTQRINGNQSPVPIKTEPYISKQHPIDSDEVNHKPSYPSLHSNHPLLHSNNQQHSTPNTNSGFQGYAALLGAFVSGFSKAFTRNSNTDYTPNHSQKTVTVASTPNDRQSQDIMLPFLNDYLMQLNEQDSTLFNSDSGRSNGKNKLGLFVSHIDDIKDQHEIMNENKYPVFQHYIETAPIDESSSFLQLNRLSNILNKFFVNHLRFVSPGKTDETTPL